MRLVLLVVPLLVACSSGPSVPDDGPAQTSCPLPLDAGVSFPGPVAGCTAPPGPTGVLDLATIGWAGHGGVLVVPEATPGVPLPVVFGFHGAGEDGEQIREALALEGPADGGAIFVYPNAIQGTWDITPTSADQREVGDLLDRLEQTYCIDPSRIYIAGFSAGAVFTVFLGCTPHGLYSAMAVVAGTDSRFDNQCCTGALSAIFIHGAQDEAIAFTEGQATATRLRGRDQCSNSSVADGPNCVAYDCPVPSSIDFCQWGGDHAVPVWAGQEIDRFFSLLP